jgi:hypothetical protein
MSRWKRYKCNRVITDNRKVTAMSNGVRVTGFAINCTATGPSKVDLVMLSCAVFSTREQQAGSSKALVSKSGLRMDPQQGTSLLPYCGSTGSVRDIIRPFPVPLSDATFRYSGIWEECPRCALYHLILFQITYVEAVYAHGVTPHRH